jgi:DNA-binding response OmpR family regulator
MNRIIVVEDSEEYQKIINRTLSHYQLTFATTAEEAAEKIKNDSFDCILVDINLPQKDGFYLLTEILSDDRNERTPVLCLTGRKDITDKVTAFTLGADDYMTKPFDPIELRARVENKLKKSLKFKNDTPVISVGNISIDQGRHRISLRLKDQKEVEVDVTQTEFKLLMCLARRPEQVFSRDQLLVSAWGDDTKVLDRVVDVHMCLLRKKLSECSSHNIKAVSGVGYKLTVNKKANMV